MRIEPVRKLFVGVKIDNKLRDAFEHCPPRDRSFFDGTDERYLVRVRAVEDTYVGKVVDAGLVVVAADDIKRNVLSIITRITQSRRSEDDVKIFAVDDGEPPPLAEKPEREPSSWGGY